MTEERILYELGRKYGVDRVGLENPFVTINLRPIVFIDVRRAFRTPCKKTVRLYLVNIKKIRDGYLAETDLRMDTIEQGISIVRTNFDYWYNQKRITPLMLEDVFGWDFDRKNTRLQSLLHYEKLKKEYVKQCFQKR